MVLIYVTPDKTFFFFFENSIRHALHLQSLDTIELLAMFDVLCRYVEEKCGEKSRASKWENKDANTKKQRRKLQLRIRSNNSD